VNGGMGTSLGPVRGMVEMANTMLASGGTSTWYHAVAFTGRFRDGAVSPHVSYVLPLDFRDGILGQTFVVGVVYVPAAR